MDTRIGIDIGRVLIDGGPGADTAFFGRSESAAMATPAVPGAFAAVARLVDRTAGRIWLVSKCGDRIQARTRSWLAHHHFHERTGVSPDHLEFCRLRPDKATICARLAITHFIDDRPDVLLAMTGVVPHRYLFGATRAPSGLIPIPTWPAAEREIERTLTEERRTAGNR